MELRERALAISISVHRLLVNRLTYLGCRNSLVDLQKKETLPLDTFVP